MTAEQHKLFTLGYQPLTKVYCGEGKDRKEGLFYGGHDSIDIFVKCISKCCKNKPNVCNTQGGNIWNCCQFEKHAGYGHRKKWKESIKTADNSTRILDFLKSTSKDLGGTDIIGYSVNICWFKEGAFYEGVIKNFDSTSGKYHVVYDDGDTEDLYLGIEQQKLGQKTNVPFPNGSGTKRQRTAGRSKLRSAGALHSGHKLSDGLNGPACSPAWETSTTPATSHLVAELLDNCSPSSGAMQDTKIPEWDGCISPQLTEAAQSTINQREVTCQPSTTGLQILNSHQLMYRHPKLEIKLAAEDAQRWLAMSDADRARYVGQWVEVKDVVEKCPTDLARKFERRTRTYAKKAMRCGDCLGEMTGLVCSTSDEGRMSAEGQGQQLRLFESSVAGQNGFSGPLYLEASNSSNKLNHIKQAPQGVGKPNVAAVEVYQQHAQCVRLMVFALDSIPPSTQLIMQACSSTAEQVPLPMNGHAQHHAGPQQQPAATLENSALQLELKTLKEANQKLTANIEDVTRDRNMYRTLTLLTSMMLLSSSGSNAAADDHPATAAQANNRKRSLVDLVGGKSVPLLPASDMETG